MSTTKKVTTGHESPEGEAVNSPRHYNVNDSGIECADLIEHLSGMMALTLKHLWRAGLKGPLLEDLRKAEWYLKRERARIARFTARVDAICGENRRIDSARLRDIERLVSETTLYIETEEIADRVIEAEHFGSNGVFRTPLGVVLSNLYDIGIEPRFGGSLLHRIDGALLGLGSFIDHEAKRVLESEAAR